jgi:hypothetical protein
MNFDRSMLVTASIILVRRLDVWVVIWHGAEASRGWVT